MPRRCADPGASRRCASQGRDNRPGTAFLKERVLSRGVGRQADSIRGCSSGESPAWAEGGRGEVEPRGLVGERGGWSRPGGARPWGALTARSSSSTDLMWKAARPSCSRGCRRGFSQQGPSLAVASPSSGACHSFVAPGWGRHAAIRPQPVGLKHKLGPLWGHAVRRARNRLRRAGQPVSARQRISPSRRP